MDKSSEILFDKFEIIEVLKKNEYAGVYLADHVFLGKKIILKVLNTETIPDISIIERFKREAKILAQLENPNIIKVLDFGTFKNFFYISFEYFRSRNLRAVINDNNLSGDEKRFLIVQLFKALHYAHSNNIIHRDIKPENILVNETFELKIGDFGLAQTENDSFITSQQSIVGTPSYMSPEQIKGEKLSAQSDLFSAGIVLYEFYTGTNPFTGKDASDSVNNIIKFDEAIIHGGLNDVPDKLKQLIYALLKKSPRERLTSAAEALELLGIEYEENTDVKTYKTRNAKKYFVAAAAIFILVISAVLLLRPKIFKSGQSFTKGKENQVKPFNESKADTAIKVENLTAGKINAESVDKTPGKKSIKKPVVNSFSQNSGDKTSPGTKLGELFIDCLPWANIYIDGKKFDTTPIEKNIELTEGKHNLKLVHPDYPEYIASLQISSDRITTIKVNLDTLFGYIDFKVFPWGEIYLNGIYKGDTPFFELLKTFPGKYKLEVKNPDFTTFKRSLSVSRNDTIVISYNFNR